jgi:hypothetical protein
MKDYEYYEKKPDNGLKMLSELERFEIFNLESAEKYDNTQNIDFIIDENGYIKYMIVGIEGDIYKEIAFVYLSQIHNESYDLTRLNGFLLILNGWHISKEISDFDYEYLTDLVGDVLANSCR